MGRIIAADLLPDLIAARFHRLIVASAGGLNTLLVIQDANALLVGELLMLFILFQHIQYALAGFNLVRIPFRRINTGAIGNLSVWCLLSAPATWCRPPGPLPSWQ